MMRFIVLRARRWIFHRRSSRLLFPRGRVVSLARSRLRKRALPSVPVSFGILGVHPNQRYCCVNSLKLLSSPTLFPKEYVNEFQKCFDRTPAVPFNTIREIITADLSKPVDAVFESIDPVPLASASVAQVHAAVLLGSRKNVIVKVLKPDVTETLSTDLSFIYVASFTGRHRQRHQNLNARGS